jgi:hypothetical protein
MLLTAQFQQSATSRCGSTHRPLANRERSEKKNPILCCVFLARAQSKSASPLYAGMATTPSLVHVYRSPMASWQCKIEVVTRPSIFFNCRRNRRTRCREVSRFCVTTEQTAYPFGSSTNCGEGFEDTDMYVYCRDFLYSPLCHPIGNRVVFLRMHV